MPLSKKHKYILWALGIYWPVLFILTHIPVQDTARRFGMSDKTMHYLAYMGLMFLLWQAISPYQKVNWQKVKVWLVLAAVVWYGAADEWLQGRMNRSADVWDFLADVIGAMIGLVILWLFEFWTAILIILLMFIFAISNMSRIDTLWQQPFINTGFHFFGYAFLTLAWIQHIGQFVPKKLRLGRVRWMLTAAAMPVAALVFVKLAGIFMDKRIWPIDCAAAVVGIACAVAGSWAVFRLRQRHHTIFSESTSSSEKS